MRRDRIHCKAVAQSKEAETANTPRGISLFRASLCSLGRGVGKRAWPSGRHLPDALLAAIAVAVYLNTLSFDFAYDDIPFVVDNPAVHSLGNVARFFVAPVFHGVLYRPVTFLSFAVDYAIAGLRPGLFHAGNVALHAGVSVLLYRVLRGVAPAAAWLAAALFAVTPLHTEVVANIASRSELLAAFFGLLAIDAAGLHQHSAGAGPGRRQAMRAALSGTLFLLALLAKESAVAVPALAITLAWGNRRGDTAAAASRALGKGVGLASRLARQARAVPLPLWGMAAALAAYLALRLHALGHIQWPPFVMLDNPLRFSDLATRVRTALMILGQNLALSFVPWRLSADYTFPQTPLILKWLDGRFLTWTGLLAASAGAALALRRSTPNIARGLAWWLAAMLPLSNLITTIGVIRAERLLYLASAGACLAAAEMLICLKPARLRSAAVLIALLVVLLSWHAAHRNLVWRNQTAIVESTARDAPLSIRARYNLADHLLLGGNCRAAVPHFQRMLATYPELATYPAFGGSRFRLAACLEKLGDLEAAELLYREVFRGNLGDRRQAQILAAVCEKRGDWHCVAGTLREFLDANREGARDASAWLALGNALVRSGRPAEAQGAYRRSLELKESPVVHFNLAGALVNLGRLTAATQQYRAAEQGGMRGEEVYVDWAATEERAGKHAVARQIAARGLIRYPASAPLQRLARH